VSIVFDNLRKRNGGKRKREYLTSEKGEKETEKKKRV
jgi:hypothetical protein